MKRWIAALMSVLMMLALAACASAPETTVPQDRYDLAYNMADYDWFSDIQLVKNVSKSDYPHPCPVPVELMERIIKLTTNEGDLVVDPFAGSGSTGVACVNTNRRFIGFEIDTLYSDMANERMAEAIVKKEKMEEER